MTLAARLRNRRLAPRVEQRAREYAACRSHDERLRWQLDAWNREWRRIRREVSYFAAMASLPEVFESWEQFTELLPVTRRADVSANTAAMSSSTRPAEWRRVTGGSTAQPVSLPAWHSETRFIQPDLWGGRHWYGIDSASRQFLIWGHSHLLGEGLRGWVNGGRRRVKDWLLGYKRFSAYHLAPESLRQAASALAAFRPDYILGYSVALDMFARVARDLRPQLRALNVKAVIGAAEAFPSADSTELLSDLFACPVAMEYGSVETNLIAHTHPDGGYRVFWRTYFVEVGPGQGATGPIRVTSLYPRCFPLVRYELGDDIEMDDRHNNERLGVASFARVAGRCNDYVRLIDGSMIHSEAFTHAIRDNAEVLGYQVVQSGHNLSVLLLANSDLQCETPQRIRTRLAKIHPELGRISVQRVVSLEQTTAGKVPMIVRKLPNA